MTASHDSPHIGMIVEGPGDLRAVPLLLRAFLSGQGCHADILGKPIPVNGKSNAVRARGIEGYVATAAARPGCKGLIVVLDADDDRTCQLGPDLLGRCQPEVRLPVAVAVAEPDYEGWLYASAETLGLDLEYDATKNGKTMIRKALAPTKYVKPTWQPRLTARMDIDVARSRSRSLDRALIKFWTLASPLDLK